MSVSALYTTTVFVDIVRGKGAPHGLPLALRDVTMQPATLALPLTEARR
jgi:hypothetical protein